MFWYEHLLLLNFGVVCLQPMPVIFHKFIGWIKYFKGRVYNVLLIDSSSSLFLSFNFTFRKFDLVASVYIVILSRIHLNALTVF